MDYEGFSLPSPSGLSIIMTTFNVASKDPFPIDMIYGPWVHTKGQVRISFSEVQYLTLLYLHTITVLPLTIVYFVSEVHCTLNVLHSITP